MLLFITRNSISEAEMDYLLQLLEGFINQENMTKGTNAGIQAGISTSLALGLMNAACVLDIESFLKFCRGKIVSEVRSFYDHLIQNYQNIREELDLFFGLILQDRCRTTLSLAIELMLT